MTPLIFLAACLACFRLTRLITDDDGPGYIFRKLRRLPPARSSAREGLACPFCVSFYFAALITGFLVFAGAASGLWAPLLGASIWGGSVLLNQAFVKLSK